MTDCGVMKPLCWLSKSIGVDPLRVSWSAILTKWVMRVLNSLDPHKSLNEELKLLSIIIIARGLLRRLRRSKSRVHCGFAPGPTSLQHSQDPLAGSRGLLCGREGAGKGVREEGKEEGKGERNLEGLDLHNV